MPDDQVPAKPKRRKAAKPASQDAAPAVKLTLTIPADLARRFGVHAEMTGVGKADLFAEMIRAHCNVFVVHRRGESGQGAETAA